MFKGVVAVGAHLHAGPRSIVGKEVDAQRTSEHTGRTNVKTASESVVGELVGLIGAGKDANAILKVGQVGGSRGAHRDADAFGAVGKAEVAVGAVVLAVARSRVSESVGKGGTNRHAHPCRVVHKSAARR